MHAPVIAELEAALRADAELGARGWGFAFRRTGAEAGGLDPGGGQGALSPVERGLLNGLRVPKRRAEWLAGRLAAKDAVRALLGPGAPEAARIEILRTGTGEPRVALDGAAAADIGVSIAHAGSLATACAYRRDGATRVGLDLERAAPAASETPAPASGEEWLDVAFNAAERRWIGERGSRATQLWTAKEAVAKALGAGLSLDLRGLVVAPGASDRECVIRAGVMAGQGFGARERFRARTLVAGGYVLSVAWPEPRGA